MNTDQIDILEKMLYPRDRSPYFGAFSNARENISGIIDEIKVHVSGDTEYEIDERQANKQRDSALQELENIADLLRDDAHQEYERAQEIYLNFFADNEDINFPIQDWQNLTIMSFSDLLDLLSGSNSKKSLNLFCDYTENLIKNQHRHSSVLSKKDAQNFLNVLLCDSTALSGLDKALNSLAKKINSSNTQELKKQIFVNLSKIDELPNKINIDNQFLFFILALGYGHKEYMQMYEEKLLKDKNLFSMFEEKIKAMLDMKSCSNFEYMFLFDLYRLVPEKAKDFHIGPLNSDVCHEVLEKKNKYYYCTQHIVNSFALANIIETDKNHYSNISKLSKLLVLCYKEQIPLCKIDMNENLSVYIEKHILGDSVTSNKQAGISLMKL